MPIFKTKARTSAASTTKRSHGKGGKKNPALFAPSSPLTATAAPGEKRNIIEVVHFDPLGEMRVKGGMKMSLKVKKALNGKGSKQTVQRVLETWKRVRKSVSPFLTPDHKRARLEWARKFKGFNYDNDEVIRIHIQVLYLPPGVEPPQFFALSKTQIPWVLL